MTTPPPNRTTDALLEERLQALHLESWGEVCPRPDRCHHMRTLRTAAQLGRAHGLEEAERIAFEYLRSYEEGEDLHPDNVAYAIRALRRSGEL